MNPFKLNRYSLLAGSLLALGFLGCSGGSTGKDAPTPPAVTPPPAGTTPSLAAPALPATLGNYAYFHPSTEQQLKGNTVYGYVIAKVRPDFDTRIFETQGFTVEGKLSFGKGTYYRLHRASDVLTALDHLSRTQGVLFAHPDMKLQATAGVTYDAPDPLTVSEQYSAYITHAMDAWTTYGFGSIRPVIVDVDTGVNWSHEDFQKNGVSTVTHAFSWWNLATNAFNSGATRPVDYVGTSTVNTDEDSHGTHTMGTIGAQGDNGKGVAGVCWQADLVSYKCFNDNDSNNSGSEWAIYGSVVDLVENRSAITSYTGTIPVNMSLGGSYAAPFDVDVIQFGLANNVVIICAMGNSGQEGVQYPAAYEGVIAVGATDGRDQKADFSTTGSHISVSAPGLNIISTGNAANDYYFMDSGTSMATPFVTGLAGYMLTFMDLTPAQIRTELETYADNLNNGTFSNATGHGRVNVLATIKDVAAKAAAGKSPAQNYANNPLIVDVANSLASPSEAAVSWAPIYLYRTDAAGNIQNYVGCSWTDSFGEAAFSLLPAGNYVASVVLAGQAFSTPVVAVTTDDATPIPAQTLNLPLTYAQVLPDQGAKQLPYASVALWDGSTFDLITEMYAYYVPMYLPMDLATGKPYLITVMPYSDGTVGEYALYLGSDYYPALPVPGTYAAPSGHAGSASQDYTNPQVIALKTVYNGNLNPAWDFYAIQLP